MEPVGCPETSVTYYQSTLRKNPEERKSQESWLSTLYLCGIILSVMVFQTVVRVLLQVNQPSVTGKIHPITCRESTDGE